MLAQIMVKKENNAAQAWEKRQTAVLSLSVHSILKWKYLGYVEVTLVLSNLCC